MCVFDCCVTRADVCMCTCSFKFTVHSSSGVRQPNWFAPNNTLSLYSRAPISFSVCLNHSSFFSTAHTAAGHPFFCACVFHRFLVSVESALGLCTEQRGFDSWSISTTLLPKREKKDVSLLFSLEKPPFLLERRKRAQITGTVCQRHYGNHPCQPWHWSCIVWDPDIR